MVDNAIKLRSNSLLCLNAEGGASAGAKIITWPCAHRGSPETHEEWQMDSDGRIRLRDRPEMCINVKGATIDLGSELVLWPCGEDQFHMHDIFVYNEGLLQLKTDLDYHFNIQGGDT